MNTTEVPNIKPTSPNFGFQITFRPWTARLTWQFNGIVTLESHINPTIIIVGILANIFIAVIACQKAIFKKPYALGLLILALVDLAVLINSFANYYMGWLYNFNQFQTMVVSSVGCKFYTYFSTCLSQLSPWTIVLISYERVISVNFPLKAKLWLRRSRSLAAWVAILVFILLINIWAFVLVELDYVDNRHIRSWSCVYESNLIAGLVYHIPVSFMACVFPVSMIVIADIAIVRGMWQIKQRRKTLLRKKDVDEQNGQMAISVMMLIVISAHLVLTLPAAIVVPITEYAPQLFWDPRPNVTALNILFTHTLTRVMHTANSAVNILLYAISGKEFRAEIKKSVRLLLGSCRYCKKGESDEIFKIEMTNRPRSAAK